VKTGRNLAEYSKEGYGSQGAVLLMVVVVVVVVVVMVLFHSFLRTTLRTKLYTQFCGKEILIFIGKIGGRLIFKFIRR
jgi:hypothetical protein